MMRQRFMYAFAFLMGLAACSSKPSAPEVPPTPPQPEARVTTAQGSFLFHLEMADTPEERERGLMQRTEMPEDYGMLFVWGEPVLTSFWMKDTLVALDILFLDKNKKVIFIAKDNKPMSEDLITPPSPFHYALEVKAGFAAKSGVKVGNTIDISLP